MTDSPCPCEQQPQQPLRASQKLSSLRNLWVTFEMPKIEEETSDHEEHPNGANANSNQDYYDDDDAISMLSYYSSESVYSFGGPPPAPTTDSSPKRKTTPPKRSITCKRIDITSPLHRSNFSDYSSNTFALMDENESNDSSSGAAFLRVDRWAPNERTPTSTSGKSLLDKEKSLQGNCSDGSSSSTPLKALSPLANKAPLPEEALKLDHCPRFPTRHISVESKNSSATPLSSLSMDLMMMMDLNDDNDDVDDSMLPEAPPEALKLDHCPRFPRRRVSVEGVGQPLATAL